MVAGDLVTDPAEAPFFIFLLTRPYYLRLRGGETSPSPPFLLPSPCFPDGKKRTSHTRDRMSTIFFILDNISFRMRPRNSVSSLHFEGTCPFVVDDVYDTYIQPTRMQHVYVPHAQSVMCFHETVVEPYSQDGLVSQMVQTLKLFTDCSPCAPPSSREYERAKSMRWLVHKHTRAMEGGTTSR